MLSLHPSHARLKNGEVSFKDFLFGIIPLHPLSKRGGEAPERSVDCWLILSGTNYFINLANYRGFNEVQEGVIRPKKCYVLL